VRLRAGAGAPTQLADALRPLLCLAGAAAADGLALAPDEARGFFRVAQYGQVYTLQARLNEMMLGVQI
jgi:hypothetical protein